MITIRIDGANRVINGLNNLLKDIPNASRDILLDQTAKQVQQTMKQEAPYRTGALSGSVTIQSPNNFTRVIEPTSRNFSPGNKYALPVETGSGPGYFPNVYSIARYYAVDMKVAWAIALSIKKSGTPANPFVQRTFNWVRGQINRQLEPFTSRLVTQYVKG